MPKTSPAAGERAVDGAAESREIRQADVLEHAHGYERVILPFHVAVVVLDEFDEMAEPFLLCPIPRVGNLLGRDVERPH